MTKNELITVRVNRESLKIIRKFCAIHNWSFAQFCDKLATILVCGIDSLMDADIEDLKKRYPYSDVLVSADIRQVIGEPQNEQ